MGGGNRGFGKDKNRARARIYPSPRRAEPSWHHADQPIHPAGEEEEDGAAENHVAMGSHALNAFISGIEISRNLNDRKGASFNLVTR